MSWLTWWGDADWIVRAVFIVLILFSLLSWTVIFYKTMRFTRFHRQEEGVKAALPRTGLAAAAPGTLSAALLAEVADLPRERSALLGHLDQAIKEQRLMLEGGLTLLATIGNSAPFIGLFGTVWGIMHALQGLGGRELSMDMVAGPVAEALVATAAGLFAAVPAVMGYNFLVRRLRHLLGLLEGNALRLAERLLTGE